MHTQRLYILPDFELQFTAADTLPAADQATLRYAIKLPN